MTDMINKPPHYQGEIECIDYIKDRLTGEQYIGYLTGAAMKYLHRWQYKGKPEEDLGKAIWYIERLKEYIGKHPDNELGLSAEDIGQILKDAAISPPLTTPKPYSPPPLGNYPYIQYGNTWRGGESLSQSIMNDQTKVNNVMEDQRAKLFAERYDQIWNQVWKK